MLPSVFLDRPFAHRGLHDVTDNRPENSLASFRAAIALGYGIELDLQISKDGQAMVFHDYDLQRLAGKPGAICQQTADELWQMPLLGGDEGVPTLQQVLELVDGQVPMLVEIKDQDLRLGTGIGALEEATAQVLNGYSGESRSCPSTPIRHRVWRNWSPISLGDLSRATLIKTIGFWCQMRDVTSFREFQTTSAQVPASSAINKISSIALLLLA